MTYEVSYLPQAEQDLIEILAYGIETWGERTIAISSNVKSD